MKMKLKIRKRTQSEWLLTFVLCLPFLMGLLYDIMHLPTFINYSIDLVLIFLFIQLVLKRQRNISIEEKNLGKWILLFLAYTAITYLLNYKSIYFYLWGLRNNFRFYLFFALCIHYFPKKSIEGALSSLDIIFYVNNIVLFVQYFVFGIYQDRLGGLFGTGLGVNGYLNIFFVIVITKDIIFYLNKRETLMKLGIHSLLMLISSAFAELKFFYVEFALIIIVASLVTKFSWKKIFVGIATVVGVYFGIGLMISLFPQFSSFSSLKGIFELASSSRGYTNAGDINRLTAISFIMERFLKSPSQILMGLGLGNCDTAQFDFLNTQFYRTYGFLHYTWLSTSFIFVELGLIGLVFFFGFYVLNGLMMIKRNTGYTVYKQISVVLSVAACVIVIYNSSLRTEAAYMLYFFLSLPYIEIRNSTIEDSF